MTPSASLVGHLAPEFDLPCVTAPGHKAPIARLSDYRGRWLILMFYPHDFSLVCPTELTAIDSRYEEFVDLGADVVAISTDSVESHVRWIATPKTEGGLGPIKYPLASDADANVARAYHSCLDPQGVALRGLFIIDPNGVVQYQVVQNLSVGRRTDEVMRVLTALQSGGLCGENWSPGREHLDTRDLKPGNIVSHYKIKEKIGDGGFASVYLAYDQTLERDVALKVIRRTEESGPSVLDEARAAAALNHGNVCTVYSIDDSEGISIIVMERLNGRTLKDISAEGPTPPAGVTRIALDIAAGMAAAHGAGIVHGDLKPANVILTDEGTAKILDFGLAARHRAISSSDTTLASASTLASGGNAAGKFAGTPGYMAPEQTDGFRATRASDVFSFGLIIFELLTAKRPFGGANILETLNQIRTIQPEEFAGAVEEPFTSLLRRMLIPDPKARTITMPDIAELMKEAAAS